MITDVKKLNPKIRIKTPVVEGDRKRKPMTDEFARRKLDKFYQLWLSLDGNRRNWKRYAEYYSGDQLHELVSTATGTITEREHISNQGKNPFQQNIIKPVCNTLIGQFRSDRGKSVVVPRMKEKSTECEILSNALQAALAVNDTRELDAAALEQKLIMEIPLQRVTYKFWPERNNYDVFIENISPYSMFFNTDINDVRGKDIDTIGRVLDYSYPRLVAAFGTTPAKEKQLKEIYSHRDDSDYVANMAGLDSERIYNMDFYIPSDSTKCRVIEAWEKIIVRRTRIHDTADGTINVTNYTIDEVKTLNRLRVEKYTAAGYELNNIPLLRAREVKVDVWHYMYLSQYGHVLAEGETPYWHGSHPFVLPMFAMVNGRLSSFVSDLIDQQRYVNRLITLWDFILGTSAKNTLIVDKASLAGQSVEDIADSYTTVGSVIALNLKDGAKMPVELGKNMANVGIMEMIQLHLKMVQDISGVHPSAQGQKAPSGTSGTLYAQEAQNSTVNSKNIFENFAAFRKNRDEKVLKTIQQFYTQPRFITVNGKSYADTVQEYNPKDVQNIEWEMVLAQSSDSPVYRGLIDEQLKEFLMAGLIQFDTYLENTNLPFSDKLLEAVRKAKEQAGAGNVPGAMATMGAMPGGNGEAAKAEQMLQRA